MLFVVSGGWMPVTTRQAAQRLQIRHDSDKAVLIGDSVAQTKNNGRHSIKRKVLDTARDRHRKSRPPNHFGLVQEIYQHNLYHLIVQAILWNQTRGSQAIIILRLLLEKYPTPAILAIANEDSLADLLHPIGLFRLRAKRLIALGQAWIVNPPKAGVVYKVRYKCEPEESFWEIAHLPGVGKYAIDSYRIFHRDQLLGLSSSWDDHLTQFNRDLLPTRRPSTCMDPEWMRVSPNDKDLSAFHQWAWKREHMGNSLQTSLSR